MTEVLKDIDRELAVKKPSENLSEESSSFICFQGQLCSASFLVYLLKLQQHSGKKMSKQFSFNM